MSHLAAEPSDLRRQGLRHRLRSATAAEHARLDRALGNLDLGSPPGYRRFLEASAAALLPLEEALREAGVERSFPDWPERSRRQAILQDLAALDGECRPLPIPDPLDLGGMLGTMYVLEGSRLGAAFLVRQVEQSAHPMVARATTYLRHGAGHDLWRRFLTALETHERSLRDDTTAVAGALQAFGLFQRAAARMHRQEPAPLAAPALA